MAALSAHAVLVIFAFIALNLAATGAAFADGETASSTRPVQPATTATACETRPVCACPRDTYTIKRTDKRG